MTWTFGSPKILKLESLISDTLGKSDGLISFRDFHIDSNQGSKAPSYLMLHNEENPLKLRNASEGKENDNVQILQPQCHNYLHKASEILKSYPEGCWSSPRPISRTGSAPRCKSLLSSFFAANCSSKRTNEGQTETREPLQTRSNDLWEAYYKLTASFDWNKIQIQLRIEQNVCSEYTKGKVTMLCWGACKCYLKLLQWSY